MLTSFQESILYELLIIFSLVGISYKMVSTSLLTYSFGAEKLHIKLCAEKPHITHALLFLGTVYSGGSVTTIQA